MVIDMRKVNLEVIRKELYSNLQEMFFGAFYKFFNETDSMLGDIIRIHRSKPFSDFEYDIFIMFEDSGLYCYREDNNNDGDFSFQWVVYFSDCKNKTVLYMKVAQQLAMQLLN